jgi:prepilin-type N-terminal cleavage/methylation domain-containing protein
MVGKKLTRFSHSSKGFTLLEVIVALTITGFVLGGLFSLVGGSKKLSWASEKSLVRAANIRAATNFALLDNEFHDLEEILRNYDYEVRAQDLLEPPLRKTQASTFALQQYEIVNPDTDEVITGNRWVQLVLPQ